jgi:hypothetical protein
MDDASSMLETPFWTEPGLRLGLRCTRCQRVDDHEIYQAFVHPNRERCLAEGWDGVVLGRIVRCKHCGAEDEYDLTTGAAATLEASLPAARRGSPEERLRRRVVIGEMRLWDGSVTRRPTAALRHLRALAEREPARSEGWRRLGHACNRYGLTDEAVEAWTRALADKAELEACWSLTEHHQANENVQQAFDFAAQTIARIRGGEVGQPSNTRGRAARTALAVIEATIPHMRQPLALMATWAHEGIGEVLTLAVSSVDLRKVRRWDRLAELFASESFISAGLTPELPEERWTALARLLESDEPIDAAVVEGPSAPGPAVPARATPKQGRNESCLCGSGKKHKKCCGLS